MDEIVAVTFTEKAAGELKLRLREALENAAHRRGRRRRARRLDAALETLEEAHVNTIHGFCAELIRERPVEACVDPLFAVLTEPQADHLYTRAFQAWLQQALASPSEGLRRALRRTSAPAFGGGRRRRPGRSAAATPDARWPNGATFPRRGIVRRSIGRGAIARRRSIICIGCADADRGARVGTRQPVSSTPTRCGA